MHLNELQATVERIFGRIEGQGSFPCKENLMPLKGTSVALKAVASGPRIKRLCYVLKKKKM